jgi:hypothetical protein
MRISYLIENEERFIDVPDCENFTNGPEIILSNKETDLTYEFNWYHIGYSVEKFLSDSDFKFISCSLEKSIKNIIENILKKKLLDFKLENYHNFVSCDKEHFSIVSKTRDLFSKDFDFDINFLIQRLEKILNIEITDYDNINNYKSHIIVRINRPNSTDFNPPHKDIYEHLDDEGYVPKFLNFWIPICGVDSDSTLPIAANSHLIPENLIFRTTKGSIVNNNKYRVRLIKSWNGENTLTKPKVEYGDVLIFSPNIIHGLAFNNSIKTRVALEFRLYKKN